MIREAIGEGERVGQMGTSGTTRWREETQIYRAYSVFGKDVEFHGVSNSPRLELRVLKEKESLEWSVCRGGTVGTML
jgi:hypothetical protein